MQRFLFLGWVRAVVYAKPVTIEMIQGTMGRVPAAADGLHGLHVWDSSWPLGRVWVLVLMFIVSCRLGTKSGG